VAAGAPDRLTPVRATEVRGLLRFWWRASRGSNHESLEAMRAAEGRIWGSTEESSPIQIEILNGRLGTEAMSVRREGDKPFYEDPRYALFPAQNKDKLRRDFRPIFKGGSFDLKFRCPVNLLDDLDAALRHWTNFGGIGSRTRRGLGALYCKETSGRFFEAGDLPERAMPRAWPQLKGAYLVMGNPKVPLPHQRAWEMAVNLLRDFRQDRNGWMGRSRWPEPDAIRSLTGQSAPAHSAPVNSAGDFPRGQFGAPIIFHFRQDGHRAGDPDETTLLPVVAGAVVNRMASPLIVKPMAISETQSVPICLVLNAPQPDGFALHTASGDTPVRAGSRNVLMEFARAAHAQWKGAFYQL
jgi:CRISPR-associated protein Cmr1